MIILTEKQLRRVLRDELSSLATLLRRGHNDDDQLSLKALHGRIAELSEDIGSDHAAVYTKIEQFSRQNTETQNLLKGLMSAISDYAAKVTAHQDKVDAALTDISGDIDGLKALIKELQDNPGPITPEDQALLDQLEARIGGLATKAEALAAATPPPTPPA